ncbi:NIPA-like protein 2 isoform X4 [Rhineura floridana]|uniref:NIPA-like protein 2 isoform X4 n=1 Tax=Rhineura floridana TaxID=261503 RepID=UPI002AC825DC|nr:NIPA-like protein 2 isoform X4 [Rhineura floridana]
MAKPRLVQNAPFGGKEISSGFLSSGWYYANQTLLLGILLAIIGNILISISLNLQKWSHLRLMRQANQKPFYRSKLWWCGIILMGTGEMGNFAAYGFASIMVIAPLGNVAVIGSAVISVLFLKENIRSEGILASLNVISVKAVATMIALSVRSNMQLTYPVFYIMLILMVLTCVFQVKFLNQAMKLYSEAEVIPMNYVFFTISAVVAGAIFYQEFQDASLLSGFMFLFGCFLSFVGVFIITRKRGKECLTSFYIDYGHIPGKKMRSKIQPDSNNLSYGSLCYEGDSVKAQS